MRRARKLGTALLALAVVTAAVYASGAFTTTTTERNVNVQVAGDGSAFLSLQKSEGPNAAFVSTSNGALQVSLDGSLSGASGVNPNSITKLENVFTITNHGTQKVSVWFTGKSAAVTFIAEDTMYAIEGPGSAVTIQPGDTLHIGFIIDTHGATPRTNLLKSVTIHANAHVSGVSVENVRGSGESSNSNEGCGPLLRNFVCNVGATVSGAADTAGDVASGAADLAGDVGSLIVDTGGDIISGTVEFFNGIYNGAVNLYNGIANAGDHYLGGIDEWVGGVTATMWDGAVYVAEQIENSPAGELFMTGVKIPAVTFAATIFVPAGPADWGSAAIGVGHIAAAVVVGVGVGLWAVGEYIVGGGTTTEEEKTKETEETEETDEGEVVEGGQDGGDDDSDRRNPCGKTGSRCVPDYETEDGVVAELRDQGVPKETINDWQQQGRDLEEISNRIDTYYKNIEGAESVIPSVYRYTLGENDLSNKNVSHVLEAYAEADNVELLPGNKGPEAVQKWIDYLDRRGVDGVHEMLRNMSGTETGYKGIAGESYIAYSLLQRSDINPDDIHIQVDVPPEDVPNDLKKDSSEIDVYVDSKVTIEGVTLDSPAIESKHWGSGYNKFLSGLAIRNLTAKLTAQAAAGQDEFVVVVTEEFMNEHRDRLNNVESKVEERLDKHGLDSNVTIVITTYEEIDS